MEVDLLKRGIISLTFCVLTALIFTEVNKNEPNPYMDEIFHIPQARNFCNGNYTHWDSKITTLPGLYMISQIILSALSFLSSKSLIELCSVQWLRFTNLILALSCFFVLREIIVFLNLSKYNTITHSTCKDIKITADDIKKNEDKPFQIGKIKVSEGCFGLKADVMAFTYLNFPLFYFFSFFYYTDVGSTCFVLLSYLLSLKNYHFLSAASSIIAILFRQTNVVWVFFVSASSCLRYLNEQKLTDCKENRLLKVLHQTILGCIKDFWKIFLILFPYLFVFVGFVVFVYVNNGIVVGDRNNHEACLNFPQMLYFSGFVMFFSCHLMIRWKSLLSLTKNLNWLLSFGILAAMFLIVHNFTVAHKYLLADNRHYTFYIWRKIINRSWYSRYILIPGYFVSWMIMYNELSKSNQKLWIIFFLLSVFVVLVPQKLLEFRYFIVPYILFKLHISVPSFIELIFEGFMYTVINAFTLYLFLYKPFSWVDDSLESLQHFMW